MQAIEAPKTNGIDKIGRFTVYTIGGLDAQQIIEAKLALMKDFSEVQANINQPKKDKQGAQFRNGQSYKYADLNSVISEIQEASKEHDIAYIQQPVMDGGKAGVDNYLLNSKGAIMDFGAYLLDVGGARPQDAGGAMTYARRYSISAIFGIASEEDTDAQEFQAKPSFTSPGQLAGLTIVYNGKRTDLTTVYAKALAGDTLAKQVIKDKGNSVNTKVAIKSINSIYEFNKKITDLEKQEKAAIQKEDQKAKAKKQEKIDHDTAKIDPFDVAMQKAGE